MPSVMEKQRKPKWTRKASCKCVKADLPTAGPVVIRCPEHRGKPSKSGRVLCYWDEDFIVRREEQQQEVAAPSGVGRIRKGRHTADGFVYYARLGGLIKIGHSKTPEWRAASLNAELLAMEPGDREYEKKIHREFASLRERGEWFRAEAPLLERIEALKS